MKKHKDSLEQRHWPLAIGYLQRRHWRLAICYLLFPTGKLRDWLERQRRYGKQIRSASHEPPPSREMALIKEKIWRKLLSHYRNTRWISGIAVNRR